MACSSSNSYHAKNVDNRSHRAKLKKVFSKYLKTFVFKQKNCFLLKCSPPFEHLSINERFLFR